MVLFAINDEFTIKEAINVRGERVLRVKSDLNETYHDRAVPMILVGTKCVVLDDEKNDNVEQDKNKFVVRETVIKTAQHHGISYNETNAKERKKVDFLFKCCYCEHATNF